MKIPGLLLLFLSAPLLAAQMNYAYSLPVDATNVTIGVKDSTGALIRTISSGKKNAGAYSGLWDGLTDSGATAPAGTYTIAVLYGNPVYTWDGVIGDTSNSFTGWNRWHLFSGDNAGVADDKFTFVGNHGWFTPSGTEGAIGLGRFLDVNPNSPEPAAINYNCTSTCGPIGITNDGTFLYVANGTSMFVLGAAPSFVTKFDALSGTPAYFTNGTLITGTGAGVTNGTAGTMAGVTLSDIDLNLTGFSNAITGGIAVQKSAQLLAVAHGNFYLGDQKTLVTQGLVHFFDKTTGLGTGLNDLTIANPTSLAFNSAGLWVTGNGVLSLITNPSGTNTVSHPITGLSNPVWVATNQNTNHIYVLDGGTSQQVKEFDAGYTLVRSYGQLGGYTDCNPTIAHDRLMVDNMAISGTLNPNPPPQSWIAVEDNGDVWVADSLEGSLRYPYLGLVTPDTTMQSGRIQHLTPNGPSSFAFVAPQIMKMVYGDMGLSHTQPTRVYSGLIEYQIDYTKPNNPGDPLGPNGNGSWQAVRDWAVGAQGACGSSTLSGLVVNHPFPGIVSSELFSNGHVYGIVFGGPGYPSHVSTMVELPTNGTPMRVIGSVGSPPTGSTSYTLARDGSFYYLVNSGSGADNTTSIMHVSLTGFDGTPNPIYNWASPVNVASVAHYNSAVYPVPSTYGWYGLWSPFEPTTGGVWGAFHKAPVNTSATTRLPHIYGMAAGTHSSFQFAVNPEVCSLYPLANDAFPCAAGTDNFDLNVVVDEGHYVIEMYGAQQSTVVPQYQMWYEDGMFLGWFGPHNTTGYIPTGPNQVPTTQNNVFSTINNPYLSPLGFRGVAKQAGGFAENNPYMGVVSVGSDMYLWLQSEGYTVPLQRWHIANLDSVHEIAGTGANGTSVALATPVF